MVHGPQPSELRAGAWRAGVREKKLDKTEVKNSFSFSITTKPITDQYRFPVCEQKSTWNRWGRFPAEITAPNPYKKQNVTIEYSHNLTESFQIIRTKMLNKGCCISVQIPKIFEFGQNAAKKAVVVTVNFSSDYEPRPI